MNAFNSIPSLAPDKVSLAAKSSEPVLVVGSVAYDNIITPRMKGTRILGGSASYACLAASYFTNPRLVGVVGNDFDPAFIERLRNRGICLEGLHCDESGPTFFWEGRYHENFNRRDTIEIHLNVFEKFRPNLPESYKPTPFVLLGNIDPELQLHVCEQLTKDNAFILADTIDLWIETKRDELLELLKRINCFVLNDNEADLLTGESNLISAGWKLLKMGPETVIIKKGEHGAYLFHPEGLFTLPAYPVTNLQDPTGAGDAFAGAFLGYLAAVNDISFISYKQAMAYATVTASLTVEAFSCDSLESAGAEAIENRYAELLEIISL